MTSLRPLNGLAWSQNQVTYDKKRGQEDDVFVRVSRCKAYVGFMSGDGQMQRRIPERGKCTSGSVKGMLEERLTVDLQKSYTTGLVSAFRPTYRLTHVHALQHNRLLMHTFERRGKGPN